MEEIRSGLQDLNAGDSVFYLEDDSATWLDPRVLLDATQLRQQLSPSAASALGDIRIESQLASTNLTLKERFSHGQVMLAEQQTAGRGRLGREWHSPLARNIYLSLGWQFDLPLSQLAGLSLVVGVAIAEALQPLVKLPVAVKWPNDVYLDRRKLGGVLIELVHNNEGNAAAIIGIGINVDMQHAPQIDQPWTDMQSHLVAAVDRNAITAAVLNSLVLHLGRFPSLDIEAFNQLWQSFDIARDADVAVMTSSGPVNGTGAGISSDYEFLLRTTKGIERFSSGDVKLRLL